MTTDELQAIVEAGPAEFLAHAESLAKKWADGVYKPSPESLRFCAFEAGMYAGLQGANHKEDCPYSTNIYRRWWMHGCIVGEERRDFTARLIELEATVFALNAEPAINEAYIKDLEATLQRVREYRERLSQTTGDVAAREVAAVLGRILEG